MATTQKPEPTLSTGRRRRVLYLIFSGVLALAIALGAYSHWLFVSCPERAVTKFVGAEKHRTLAKAHSDYDWYIEVALQPGDGEAIMKRYAFRPGYSREILAGRIDDSHIRSCQACWSYMEAKGPYDYVLAVLSSDKMNLQLYEVFGD
jgi:hypothetical protein